MGFSSPSVLKARQTAPCAAEFRRCPPRPGPSSVLSWFPYLHHPRRRGSRAGHAAGARRGVADGCLERPLLGSGLGRGWGQSWLPGRPRLVRGQAGERLRPTLINRLLRARLKCRVAWAWEVGLWVAPPRASLPAHGTPRVSPEPPGELSGRSLSGVSQRLGPAAPSRPGNACWCICFSINNRLT